MDPERLFRIDVPVLEALLDTLMVWELGGHSEIEYLEAGAGRGLAGYHRASHP